MSHLQTQIRRAVRIAGFATVTGVMLTAYGARKRMAQGPQKNAVRDRWLRRWSDALLHLFQVEVIVRHEGNVASRAHGVPPASTPGRGRLVIMNHRSTIDTAIALRTFGGRMVSRADLAKWPLLGSAARTVGTVFVERTDSMSGAVAVRAMRELLRAGETVNVFAEGTTFADDEIRPFHAGAFVAALHTGCEIVPVGIAYARGSGAAFVDETFPQHLARMAGAAKTRAAVVIGTPFVVSDTARSRDLVARARDAVGALVREARASVDAPH